MFLYVANKCNTNPEYTLRLSSISNAQWHFIEYISAPLYKIPKSLEHLKQSKPSKSWAKLRTRKAGFSNLYGAMVFELIEQPADIEPWLDQVHSLFMKRWANDFSRSAWMTKSGFDEYAQALLTLSAEGSASLGVLYVKETRELLAYSYNLHDTTTIYFYQHTASVHADYRKFGLGKLFINEFITQIVADGRFSALDFMLGEQEYKLEWADSIQKVYLKIDRANYSSQLGFMAAILKKRVVVRVMRTKVLKHWLKRVLR